MGNIVGQSLDPYVGKQVNKRQEVYGGGAPGDTRTLDEITYLNSRTAWIKLASGTSMTGERLKLLKKGGNELVSNQEGTALAKNNVLFNGLSRKQGDKLIGRSGITGVNKAYGVGGTDFGFSPMPGIVDASVKYLNRGSLKTAIVNIKAHNKDQFDVIDALYMRLKYHVLLEWGNSNYFSNPPNSSLTNMGSTLIETKFFQNQYDNSTYVDWLPLIEQERERTSGNYDALFGQVNNFSWTFEPDGTYNIQLSLITQGDIIESFKVKVPIYSDFSKDEFTNSVQAQTILNQPKNIGGVTEGLFASKYIVNGVVDEGKANADGYFGFTKDQFIGKTEINAATRERVIRTGGRSEQYKSRTNGGDIFLLSKYKDNDGVYWFFILSASELWNLEFASDSRLGTDGKGFLAFLNKEGDTSKISYQEALNKYTTLSSKEIEENKETIESKVKSLKESKLSLLFFRIKEIGSTLVGKSNSQKGVKDVWFRTRGKRGDKMGYVLDSSQNNKQRFEAIDLPKNSKTSNIVFTEMSIGTKAQNAYYIRLGTLLEYLQNHVFFKISPSLVPIISVDFDTEENIMYTLPNQLSTDPGVCIIQNNNFRNLDGSKSKYWEGLESFTGEVNNNAYGKVMNIYLNLDYIETVLNIGGELSMFDFLSTICRDLNLSLGNINNLEPVVDEKRNTIVIIEQTSIPGEEEITKNFKFQKPKLPKDPVLEVFGYNPKDNNSSNFVKSVGLKTEVTKEYATMITIGATAGGYVSGEESTAFSKWNVGIEDRFRKNLIDGSSTELSPIEKFENENEIIKRKYVEYLNQSQQEITGLNPVENTEIETYTLSSQIVADNTSAVNHYNSYLQASASLNSPNAESSVGFLPFNLQLTLDGISGIKIYNKLEINQSFLPSNYPETLEFIITAVDHKLLGNTWETELSTIGISKARKEGSLITSDNFLSTLSRISKEIGGAAFEEGSDNIQPFSYEVWNGAEARGGFGRRFKFEELGTHWPGSSNYTQYVRDETMRTGEISILRGKKPITVVYDLVMYADNGNGVKNIRCNLPSPIGGTVISAGIGENSSTTITGGGETVKMLHMDPVYVKKGDKIRKGQIIGKQGDKMNAKGVSKNVHLHIQCSRKVLTEYMKILTSKNAVPPLSPSNFDILPTSITGETTQVPLLIST
tara:strand:+ start:5948 stop:9430 length:3483 start_codon:yes stop_codon:yes gene_type:complete